MITCETAKEYISQKIDDELELVQDVLLDEHLTSCTHCRDYAEEMLKLDQMLSRLPEVRMEESIVDLLIAEGKIPGSTDTTITDQESMEKKAKRTWYKKVDIKPWHKALLVASLMISLIPTYYLINQQNMMTESVNDEMMQMAKEAPVLENPEQSENQESMGITGITVENLENGTADTVKERTDYTVTSTKVPAYQVSEIDHQLVVYAEDKEIYRTPAWASDLKMVWQYSETNSNHIIYSLYNQADQLMAKYQIDLEQKNEEKIE